MAGESREINWSVTSLGNNEIETGWFDELYLSRDAVLDTNGRYLTYSNTGLSQDRYLTHQYNPNTGLSQGSYDISLSFKIEYLPWWGSKFEDGDEDWHLIIKTDAYDRVSESNENNNIQAIPIKLLVPDLDVTDFQVPLSATVHETIPISWTVDNLEEVPAVAEWFDVVYLSDDETLNYHDDFVSIDDVNLENDDFVTYFKIDENTFEEDSDNAIVPLSGSDGYSLTKNITIPNSSVGSKYLIFAADNWEHQIETDETNNFYVAPIELSGVDVDLSITGKSSKSTVSLGESIDLE